MKRLAAFFVVLVSVAAGCSAEEHVAADQKELTRLVDQLCESASLRRVSDIHVGERHRRGRHLEVTLAIDDHERRYDIDLDAKGRIESFMPQKFSMGNVAQGYDTLPAGPDREMCTRVTRAVGEPLRWKWVSGPLIQRHGDDFVVTYITMSDEEEAEILLGPEPVLLHPYITFLVTPKGTVFGGFHGS